MTPRQDLILFLDLETTGTDEIKDDIIEVGLSMVDATKEDYPELDSYSCVINPRDSAFVRMMDKKVVREMHEKNGLLAEILYFREEGYGAFPTTQHADVSIMNFIRGFQNGDESHIPLAGSGVTHFDRKFIKAYLPFLDKSLTHWAYDVGSYRRAFQKAGIGWLNQETGKTHRALDDARFHADEWRYHQRYIRG